MAKTLVAARTQEEFREFVKSRPGGKFIYATPRNVRGFLDCDVVFLPGWEKRRDVAELVPNLILCLSDQGVRNGFLQLLGQLHLSLIHI